MKFQVVFQSVVYVFMSLYTTDEKDFSCPTTVLRWQKSTERMLTYVMTVARWLMIIDGHLCVEIQTFHWTGDWKKKVLNMEWRRYPLLNNLHAITFTTKLHNFLPIITFKTITIICGLKQDEWRCVVNYNKVY
jgi:hypothetical protein